MTRRDYETIVACFAHAYNEPKNDERTLNDVLLRLKLEFSMNNPRFDSVQFDKAIEDLRKELTKI